MFRRNSTVDVTQVAEPPEDAIVATALACESRYDVSARIRSYPLIRSQGFPLRGQSKEHEWQSKRARSSSCPVWRDFVPSRRLNSWEGEDSAHQVVGSDSNLQEEVYSWHLWEDFRDGITDDETRRRLEEQPPQSGRLASARPNAG